MKLNPRGYRERIVDSNIDEYMSTFGAVCIKGPKYCGKTWTARHHTNSEINISDSDGTLTTAEKVRMDINLAVNGEEPRLIDEWQIVPGIWDKVRNKVDEGTGSGRFVLTGSFDPKRDSYYHSGSGRFGTIEMSTMTLYELGISSGDVTLGDIADGKIKLLECGKTTYEDLADFVLRGGWPNQNLGRGNNSLAREYVRTASKDACSIDGRSRDTKKMSMLISSLARNESTLVSDSCLRRDMTEFDDESIAVDTMRDYLDCLRRINILVETPCFRPNLRSDQRIGKSPKRHLADVSLSLAALGIGREKLLGDRNTFGFMFESLCEHDLGVYAAAAKGKLFHYRDGRGREIDAVVELEDGRWIAIEIKLSADDVEEAAKKLIALNQMFEKEGCPPCALCIVCGVADCAYTRPDGVVVVPVAALGP